MLAGGLGSLHSLGASSLPGGSGAFTCWGGCGRGEGLCFGWVPGRVSKLALRLSSSRGCASVQVGSGIIDSVRGVGATATPVSEVSSSGKVFGTSFSSLFPAQYLPLFWAKHWAPQDGRLGYLSSPKTIQKVLNQSNSWNDSGYFAIQKAWNNWLFRFI